MRNIGKSLLVAALMLPGISNAAERYIAKKGEKVHYATDKLESMEGYTLKVEKIDINGDKRPDRMLIYEAVNPSDNKKNTIQEPYTCYWDEENGSRYYVYTERK